MGPPLPPPPVELRLLVVYELFSINIPPVLGEAARFFMESPHFKDSLEKSPKKYNSKLSTACIRK